MTDRLIRLQALNETLTNEKAALQMRLNSEVQVRFVCARLKHPSSVAYPISLSFSLSFFCAGTEPTRAGRGPAVGRGRYEALVGRHNLHHHQHGS
jgi:hypothetical protein